jgi:hypothetical protein
MEFYKSPTGKQKEAPKPFCTGVFFSLNPELASQ